MSRQLTRQGDLQQVEVRLNFLGQDSLVQAPVLEKPAYSPLSGKSADPSRKVSLHRSFLHRRSYAAVLDTLWWDAVGTSPTEKPANSSSKVTIHGNLLARIPTQFAHPLRGITAKPRYYKAVQRVSRQLDASGGPSTSGGLLSVIGQLAK